MSERTGLVTMKGKPVTLAGNEVKIGQLLHDQYVISQQDVVYWLFEPRLSSQNLFLGTACDAAGATGSVCVGGAQFLVDNKFATGNQATTLAN